MGIYKYIREAWNNPENNSLFRERMIQWRKDPATIRIEHPTRLDRARSLGFKAKPGIVVLRQRVARGGRMNPKHRHPRRSKRMSRRKDLALSYQTVAEIRAQKSYPNMEVLNSYWVGKDGQYYWFEIIMVDKSHPAILADPQLNWIAHPAQRGRVFRGLTASAKRSRGILTNKGLGAEKLRPSLRAHNRTGK